MSLLEIILLLVAISAFALYFFTKQTVKEQKQELKNSDLRYQEVIHLNKKYSEKDRQRVTEIENLNQLMKEHGNDFRELQSLYDNAKEEIRELQLKQPFLPKGIVESIENQSDPFFNNATISSHGVISIHYKELFTDPIHTMMIDDLVAANRFPTDLQNGENFQFDLTSMEVSFDMVEFEGDKVKKFKSWDEFLFIRDEFIESIKARFKFQAEEAEQNAIIYAAVVKAKKSRKEVTNA